MVQGHANKILRVDLTSRKITVDEPDESFYRLYLGGAGFVQYYLLTELEAGIDPLSPDNILVFAPGPMTAAAMPGAGRHCVGAKSPLTGGIAKAESGGHWGFEFKRAGFDAMVVKGRADSPVYIWIQDGEVEIRDASGLWGTTVLETHDAIIGELGDKLIRTTAIGPAGENMVRFACIMNDLRSAAGRGGTGAVMGSKNLKAIAVRGHNPPVLSDPEKIREMGRWMNANYGSVNVGLVSTALHDLGTGDEALMVGGNEIGNLPTRNWGDGYFDEVKEITAEVVKNEVRVDMEGCAACSIRCKKMVEFDEPYQTDRRNGGPEYETLAALGSFLGISDIKAICKANDMASLYSMDTISLGGVIAFAMECYENEILTPKDTGGIELRFGNADAMLKTVELIARREGFGDILADGSRKAAERIGSGAEEYAMQVKGLELGMHEPRLKQGLGLLYSVEAQGADHCSGIHDTAFTTEGPGLTHMHSMGVYEPLPANDLGPGKVHMAKMMHLWRLFVDALGVCYFVPWSISQQAEIVKAVTGWDFTVLEATKVGERVATMGRAFNTREGFTAADDALPKRFFSPTPRGGLKNTAIDKEAMDRAIHTFYTMMGWDSVTGVPTVENLEELGIGWVTERAGLTATV